LCTLGTRADLGVEKEGIEVEVRRGKVGNTNIGTKMERKKG
jgi:hypothetical protein